MQLDTNFHIPSQNLNDNYFLEYVYGMVWYWLKCVKNLNQDTSATQPLISMNIPNKLHHSFSTFNEIYIDKQWNSVTKRCIGKLGWKRDM